MANSVDPDQTAPIGAVCSGSTLFASILNSSVMLGNYLQQTTSADDIFKFLFFLGALRVSVVCWYFFANSLDPEQARQNIRPDLDQNCLKLWGSCPKQFFEKVDFEKKSRQQKKYAKYPEAKSYSFASVYLFLCMLGNLEICLTEFLNQRFSYHSEVRTRPLLNLGKKDFNHQNWEKLILDHYFK